MRVFVGLLSNLLVQFYYRLSVYCQSYCCLQIDLFMKNSICSREPIVLDSKCHNPTSTGTMSSCLTLPFRYLGFLLPFVVNSQISHIKYGIYTWVFSGGLDFWIFCVSFMKELHKSSSKKGMFGMDCVPRKNSRCLARWSPCFPWN